MTGYIDLNSKEFNEVANKLRDDGYMAINPIDINPPEVPWNICLKEDIKHLLEADGMVLLKGWEESRGALLEIFICSVLGIPIYDAYSRKLMNIKERDAMDLLEGASQR